MKREDPKKVKARNERDRTAMRVAILANGIARELTETHCGQIEHLALVVESINSELVPALKAAEAAEKKFEPYWRRRRHRVSVSRRNPKTAAKVPAQVIAAEVEESAAVSVQ